MLQRDYPVVQFLQYPLSGLTVSPLTGLVIGQEMCAAPGTVLVASTAVRPRMALEDLKENNNEDA